MSDNNELAKNLLDVINGLEIEIPGVLEKDMYLYAMRDTETGEQKLGISADPEARLKQLQEGCGANIELVHKCPVQVKTPQDSYDIRGEWFNKDIAIDLNPDA